MDLLLTLLDITSALILVLDTFSDIVTIVASLIAIYIIVAKRESIASLFTILANYNFKLSLSEINSKLVTINSLDTADPKQYQQIKVLVFEVIGQIRGNEKLSNHFSDILDRLEDMVSQKARFSQHTKASLVCELIEMIRNLNIEDLKGRNES